MGCCKGVTPSTAPDPTVPKEFSLDNVQGYVCITGRVIIPLFGTINIHGNTDILGQCMQAHVLADQHGVPSFPHALYQLPHMESYTQVPPECQYA